MAPFAAAGNALVNRTQKYRRRKYSRGIMTDAAIIPGRYMIHLLGCRDPRVMAGRAVIAVYTQVVKHDTCESGEVVGNMTGRTVQGRGHVVHRLAESDAVVVA